MCLRCLFVAHQLYVAGCLFVAHQLHVAGGAMCAELLSSAENRLPHIVIVHRAQ